MLTTIKPIIYLQFTFIITSAYVPFFTNAEAMPHNLTKREAGFVPDYHRAGPAPKFKRSKMSITSV